MLSYIIVTQGDTVQQGEGLQMATQDKQEVALEEWKQASEKADGTCEIFAGTMEQLVNALSETSPITTYVCDDFGDTLNELCLYCHCVEQVCGRLVDCTPLRQLLNTAEQCDAMSVRERQASKVSIPSYRVIAELLTITDSVLYVLLHTNADLVAELGKPSYFRTFERRGGKEKITAVLSGVPVHDICSA